jgi:hypothetical protein
MLVCGVFWKQKLSISWFKTQRENIIKENDPQELTGAVFEQDAPLDTTIERLPELIWCLKAREIGSLVPKDVVENQLLIFDHSHNTLYVCPKDEATLENLAKFLKEENLII